MQVLETALLKEGPLGITVENVDSHPNSPAHFPPILTHIVPGGAADRSGQLRVGDHIFFFNGQRLYDHKGASKIISEAAGWSPVVLLRKRRATAALLRGHGFGTVGPLRSFFEKGASIVHPDGSSSVPPLQLWTFLLLEPPAEEARPMGGEASPSASPGPDRLSVELAEEEHGATSDGMTGAASDAKQAAREHAGALLGRLLRRSLRWGWPLELASLSIDGAVAVRVASALSLGIWSEAAEMSSLLLAVQALAGTEPAAAAGSTAGGSGAVEGFEGLTLRESPSGSPNGSPNGSPCGFPSARRNRSAETGAALGHVPLLLDLLRSQRARWAAELAWRRRVRYGVMVQLGEAESAARALDARAKVLLRQVHALVAHALFSAEGEGGPAGGEVPPSPSPSAATLAKELPPTCRPDGTSPTCFCYPPAMMICRECSAVKLRLENATEDVARRLDVADAEGGAPPLRRSQSLQSLREVAVLATSAACAVGRDNPQVLQERLQRMAVHSILLERAMRDKSPSAASWAASVAAAAAFNTAAPASGPTSLPSRGASLPASPGGDPPRILIDDMDDDDDASTSTPPPAPLALPDVFVLPCVGSADELLHNHTLALRNTPAATVGLPPDICARLSPRAFDTAAAQLRALPSARGPQAKLRCMLRAWECVLGVLGLAADSPSADDFLPGMACALLHATPQRLVSSLCSMVNFAVREDYEDMFITHFVAAMGIVAQLPVPERAVLGALPQSALPGARAGGATAGGGSSSDEFAAPPSEGVWRDYSDREPSVIEEPGAKPAIKKSLLSSRPSLFASRASVRLGGARSRIAPVNTGGTAQPSPVEKPVTAPASGSPGGAAPVEKPIALPTASFEKSVIRLVEMGFPRFQASAALRDAGGDPRAALQILLAGPASSAAAPEGVPPPADDDEGSDSSSASAPADPFASERQSLLARKLSLQTTIQRYMASPTESEASAHSERLEEFRRVSKSLDELEAKFPAPRGSALPPAPPATPPPPTCLVQCPSCTNQLRVVVPTVPTAFACPACSAKFKVDPPPPPSGLPPTGSGAGGGAGTGSRAGGAAAAGEKVFQASCPRCSASLRFSVANDEMTSKLSIKCTNCMQPFAIQL
jgi:hypothetical protein